MKIPSYLLSAAILATLLTMSGRTSTAAGSLQLETATIADLQAAFASGSLTSVQVVEAYLKRIEAYDKQGPMINAVLTPNPRALAEARALDAERKGGKV